MGRVTQLILFVTAFAHKPLVVVLRLEDHNIFEHTHAEFLHALSFRANVRDASTFAEARRYLTSTARPHAVVVADARVALPPYREINHLLVEYAAAGGTVIYAGDFSTLDKLSDVDLMFNSQWGLPWHASAYTNVSDVGLSPHFRGLSTKALEKRFTMSGLFLRGVAPKAAVYLERREIKKIAKGKGVQDSTQTAAAAFTVIGRGRVGYVGDVIVEEPTTKLMLEMCFHPASRTPIAPGTGEPIKVPHTVTETPPVSPVKRSILVLSLQKDDWINELYAPLYNALKKNSEMTEALTIHTANQVLSSTPLPHAVLISDAAITHRKYDTLCNRLVSYVRNGGIVVFGMQFSNHLPLGKARAFFDRFSVPWDAGSYHRTTFALNPAGIPAPLSKDALQPSFSMKAVHVKNVPRESAVYLPTSASRVESLVFAPEPIAGARAEESPAVFARVAQGYVGYVGDVNGEQGSLRVLLEMCGVKVQPGDMGPRTFATGVTIGPGGIVSERMMETEQETPLPAPAPPPRVPGAREAEVKLRAETRAMVRAEKMKRADMLKTEGNKLFGEEKWAQAAEKYRAAALLAGPHPVYLSNLGICLLKLQLWELADSAASRALLHDPKHVKALYRRALARKEMERLTAAEHDIERLLKIDRTNIAALDEREDIRGSLDDCCGIDDWPGDEDLAGQALDAALPIEDESDSEDFTHAGNGIPCKFYNHGGCLHGSGCKFKHAPDSKSVRDDLGRNVCVYWLVGYCRFDDRCTYAHDKIYLPVSGWWTDEGRLARLRKAFADAVAADPLTLPPGASENILAEALKPGPWRKDLWAVIKSYADEAAEEERLRLEDEGDGWESEDDGWESEDDFKMEERMANGGWTDGEMEEMMMYGIKPWDIDAYDELLRVRDALGEF